MPTFNTLVSDLKQARGSRDSIAEQLSYHREELISLKNQISVAARKDDQATVSNLENALQNAEQIVAILEGDLQNAISLADQTHQDVLNLGSPKQLVSNLDDNFPFLLMPVRVEARFMPNQELWVRFFPDDIHVDTHEPSLTASEFEDGKAYWTTIWYDYYNQDTQLGAWRVLARAHGPERASYIATSMTPTNSIPAVNDPNPPAPLIPTKLLFQEPWTRAAYSRVMPDRFLVRLYNGGSMEAEAVGSRIPEPLVVGPDPRNLDQSFTLDGDGRLDPDPAMRWMTDFTEAVAVGMGVIIPLTAAQAASGFDQVVVLGLRNSATDQMGKVLLENLITHKRYMPGGFHLVPQGTPTNNTGDQQSGFSNLDLDEAFTYAVERQNPLFIGNPGAKPELKSDGQWLAELLGLDYSVLHHVSNADRRDIAEAISMNQVLWPTTMGYFMENLMRENFTLNQIDNTRRFFTQFVSARGPLPAFRVGEQPYGILPATAFSKLHFPSSEPIPRDIKSLVDGLEKFWDPMVGNIWTVKNNPANDWQEALLHILGLHATSVEHFQRYALGPMLYWNQMLFMGYNPQNAVTWWQMVQNNNAQLMASMPFLPKQPWLFDFGYWMNQLQLVGEVVDSNPLSESRTLSTNYIAWLESSPLDAIRNEDFGGDDAPRSLLYLLMRHAYLLENWDTAVRLMPGQNWSRLEEEMLHWRQSPQDACDITRWDMLFGFQVPSGETGPMDQFLKSSRLSFYSASEFLLRTRENLAFLKSVPTARLERLMREHLDLCTYRLDAWMTGLVNYRLDYLRRPGPGLLTAGIYLGAYGWLFDLRPAPARQVVPQQDIPAAFDDPGAQPLTYEPDNAGFVHGPSLQHATTAAIMRENYISKDGQQMEVNLSSERVRKALRLIEGIQNGQDLAALLGYRLERALHDGYPGLEMDQYLLPLRQAFPLKADQVTVTHETGTAETTYAGEATESRHVLHGLDLLSASRNVGYPYGVNALPGSGAVRSAIEAVVDELEDMLDAIGDLTLSEGVFQAVGGNYARAGAALSALSEGKYIPDPEILRTPRSGLAMTHRMGLLIDNDGSNPWSGVATSERMKLEPVLNHYAGRLLGDPAKVFCRGVYVTDEGLPTETQHPFVVKLEALNLQPLDFLRVFHDALENDGSELSDRISYHVRQQNSLDHGITVRLDYQDRTGMMQDQLTFYEFGALAGSLGKLIGESRPLTADDFTLPSESGSSSLSSKGLDYAYTWNLVFSAYQNLLIAESDLTAHLGTVEGFADPAGDPAAPAAFNALRAALFSAAEFGLGYGVPESAYGNNAAIQTMLLDKARSIGARLLEKQAAAEAALPSLALGSYDPQDSGEMLAAASKALMGEDFVLVPRFDFRNQPELYLSYTDRAGLLLDAPPLAVEEWMQGAAKVRPQVATYEKTVLMAGGLQPGLTGLDLLALQLPYKKDDRWLGVPFPSVEPEQDTLSLVLQCSPDFIVNKAAWHSGLLVDDWVERIPSPEETTGIVYNYHEPDTEPPQSLLLAVSPTITNSWDYEDLFDTLLETIDWMKKRAVEPDHLDDTPLAQILPGVMGPVTNPDATITLDYRINNESYHGN